MKKILPLTVVSVIAFTFFRVTVWYYVNHGAQQFNDPNYNILMSFLAVAISLYVVFVSFFLMNKA